MGSAANNTSKPGCERRGCDRPAIAYLRFEAPSEEVKYCRACYEQKRDELDSWTGSGWL